MLRKGIYVKNSQIYCTGCGRPLGIIVFVDRFLKGEFHERKCADLAEGKEMQTHEG